MHSTTPPPLPAVHPELLASAQAAQRELPGLVISLFDSSGIFRYVSHDPMPVRGYKRADLYGHHYTEFIVPEELPHLNLAITDTHLNGESVEIGCVVRCKDGGKVYLRVSSQKLEDPVTGEEFHMTKSRIIPETKQ